MSYTKVEYYGYSPFYNKSKLTSVTIGNSVTRICENAFKGCTGLAGVVIPGSVTSIESSAFSGCSGLASIEIPGSVTSIGNSAFSGCDNLFDIKVANKKVITISENVFSVDSYNNAILSFNKFISLINLLNKL